MNRLSRLLLPSAIFVPFVTAQSQYVNDVLALKPAGYWRLNGNASDSTGQGNNGTLINGVTFTGPGGGPPTGDPAEQAAVFDNAQNQYISMSTTAANPLFAFDWFHPLTMMIWVKTGYTSNNMILLAKEENSGNYRGPYLVIDNGPGGVAPQGSGRFAFLLQATPSGAGGTGGNFLGVEASASVNDGNWHFLAATYDGSGHSSGIRLYLDGNAAPAAVFGNGDSLNGLTTLNNVPVAIGARDTGAGSFDGLLSEAAIFGTALSAAQIRQLESDTGTLTSVLPQIAFGGGWYTAVYFVNTTSNAVAFPVNFVNDDGTPLNVPSAVGTSMTVNIAPRGTAIFELPNAGPLTQGYAAVSLPGGVTGYGVFRQTVAGQADQEAVVPLSSASSTINTLIWDDTNYVTAIAIANPSSTAETVLVTAWDNTGSVVGNASVSLNAKSKTAARLRDLPGLGGVVGKRGSAAFTVNSGGVAVLGLRFNGAAFTSIPAGGQ